MKSPREIAEAITKGEIPPQYIGKKTFAVLKQEIFSLVNRYNPETMSEFEKTVYQKDLAATVEGILQFDQRGQDKLFAMFKYTYEDDSGKSKSKEEELKSEISKSAFTHIKNPPKID